MEYGLFIPQFGNLIITIFAFILCLSIIVFVHEFGHYFIGKLSGIHAEVFSIGFGPILISKKDKNGTRWQIAAFPFGGFVKFLGDKNSAGAPQFQDQINCDSAVLDRASMHGAPLWARFFTVAAGPIFNFLFSGIIFFLIYLTQGTTKLPLTVHELYDLPFEQKLQLGDQIQKINEVVIQNGLSELNPKISQVLSNATATYTVERKGEIIELQKVNQQIPRVAQVLPKSAAIAAGLEEGDVILSIDDEKIKNFDQIRIIVEASSGRVLKVKYWRKSFVKETKLKPTMVDLPSKDGGFERIYRVGIVGDYFPFEPEMETESLVQAFWNSLTSTYRIMKGSIEGLYHIVFGNISSCNLSGPISIAETSGQMAKQGGLNYLWFIAVLSTAIGMINLFPIPVLDGGHLMFFAIEAGLGKKPDPRLINTLMTFGFLLLVSVMIFSIFNDFLCP